MSLLTICQAAATRIGIPTPASIVGSSDETNKRLLALAQEEGQDLAYRKAWNQLLLDAVFTTDGSTAYDLSTIAPAFDYMTTQRAWNRTDREPVTYINPDQYQAEIAWGVLSVNNKFRIRNDQLIIEPAIATGQTLAFEYMSRAFCKSATGTPQLEWLADTDTGRLDEDIMKLGLVWRYRKMIGFDYSGDLAAYERRVAAAMARDGASPTINMGGSPSPLGKLNIPDIGFGS